MSEAEPKKRLYAVMVRPWDLAVTDKTDSDYTCSALITLLSDGRAYISDGQRFQCRWPDARERIIQTALRDGPKIPVLMPVAGNQAALLNDVQDDPRMSRYMVEPVKETTAKLFRANLWLAHAYRRELYLVDDGPWVRDFLEECERFTGHDDPHDDWVDMVSMAFDYFQTNYTFMLHDPSLRPKKLDKRSGNNDNHARNVGETGPPRRIRRPNRGRRTFL